MPSASVNQRNVGGGGMSENLFFETNEGKPINDRVPVQSFLIDRIPGC